MSSRSHAVFSIIMQQRRVCPVEGSETSGVELEQLSAKFHLVDLGEELYALLCEQHNNVLFA